MCTHTLTRTHITPACIHVCTYVCLVQYIRSVLTQAKVYPPLVVISGVTMKCLVIVLVCAVLAEGIHRLVLTLFLFHIFTPAALFFKFSLKHNFLFSSLIVNDNSLSLSLPLFAFAKFDFISECICVLVTLGSLWWSISQSVREWWRRENACPTKTPLSNTFLTSSLAPPPCTSTTMLTYVHALKPKLMVYLECYSMSCLYLSTVIYFHIPEWNSDVG